MKHDMLTLTSLEYLLQQQLVLHNVADKANVDVTVWWDHNTIRISVMLVWCDWCLDTVHVFHKLLFFLCRWFTIKLVVASNKRYESS